MKIRSGFVSNSSSSSFIISNKNFPNVRSLATYMLKKKIRETSDYHDYDWKDESINDDKKFIKKLKDLDENQSVCFPSCNYDTYIKKIGDQYFVATCNNTNWDLNSYSEKLSENTKEALNDLLNTYDESSNEYENIYDILNSRYNEFYHIDNDYYDLRHDIIGIETYDYCPNVDNHNSYTHLWQTRKYGKICLICNPVLKRKEKLEEINKLSK